MAGRGLGKQLARTSVTNALLSRLGSSLTLVGHLFLTFILRLNLSPLLVVLSLLFWGWLWGITGMVLSVPIMATIKIVCENIPSLRFISLLMSSK